MKKCNRCNVEKESSNFSKNRKVCRSCRSIDGRLYKQEKKAKLEENGRVCKRCNTVKPIDDYRKKGTVCSDCKKTNTLKYYEANKQKTKEHNFNFRTSERGKLYKVQWVDRNRERVNLLNRASEKRNLTSRLIRNAKRRAIKLNATPNWSVQDEFNQFIIEEAYNLAKLRSTTTNLKWHVDHIVPLRSKLVCGLHIWNNLQVIPAIDNIKKQNLYWPNMP